MENSDEFTAAEFIALLKEEGMTAYVTQTGGNTATFYIDNGPEFEVMAIGPGSYNWGNPGASEFTTDELSYALDYYDRNDEYREPEPENFYIAPGTSLQEAAREIAAKYRELNGGK